MSTLLLVFPQSTTQIESPNAFTSSNISGAATVGEIWNDNAFDENNLNTLLKYVSGSETISTKDLSYLYNNEKINEKEGISGITAKDMQGFSAGGKTAGKDIVVTFGDFDWTPTYLSKDKSGELILTLWLTDSAQLNGGVYDEGADKKFDSSGTATWNAGTSAANTPTDNYPDNMYGTSYMNAVVLNNGGNYKASYAVDEVTHVDSSKEHVFAKFTIKEGNTFYKYLVTPSEVTWQEYGQDKRLNTSYTLLNENWSKTIDKNGTIEGDPTSTSYKFNYNYASKERSDQWKNSTLWLPSMSETGYSGTKEGIWQTSTAQRSNTTYSWLRSGGAANNACRLHPAGSVYIQPQYVYDSYAVRPALHLNLTEAAKNAKQPTLADTTAEYAPDDPTNESFKDIYKITNPDGSIDFHIKTAEGFLKLSEATAAGSAFDPKWTFYLDDSITVNADSAYTPIGASANPFTGTFNGQGCTLNFNLANVKDGSIFGTISDSTFCNLNINYDVTVTGEFKGLCARQITETTCNMTHLNIGGEITASTVYGLGEFYVSNTNQNLYDVNLNFTSISASFMLGTGYFENLNMDSCSFIIENTSAREIVFNDVNKKGVVTNCEFKLNAPQCDFVVIFDVEGSNADLTVVETKFDVSVSESARFGVSFSQEGSFKQARLYDVEIICKPFLGITFTSVSDSIVGVNYPQDYYYSGVFCHDANSGKTTILDSNFTSHKWRIDTSDEDAIPVLTDYNHVGSNRNPNMESLDMRKWVSEKSKA